MGGSRYSSESRSFRATEKGYATKSLVENFPQAKLGKIHASMDPKTIRMREARDNEHNPTTYPIIFGMDVTGSMMNVPQRMIQNQLPTMISKIMEAGVEYPAFLFLALGDSTNDDAPLQVGQFESGDEGMDMWLERVWPEGKGGSNAGESYLWAWYFAACHTVTDAWEKRRQKGLLITFGDEPCLPIIHPIEFEEVMGDVEGKLPSLRAEDLLAEAKKKWHVCHIHLEKHRPVDEKWKTMLGQNLVLCEDEGDIPAIVAKMCAEHCSYHGSKPAPVTSFARDIDEDMGGDGDDDDDDFDGVF